MRKIPASATDGCEGDHIWLINLIRASPGAARRRISLFQRSKRSTYLPRGASSRPKLTEREDFMKFRINWSITEDKWLPVLKKWIEMSPQERANTGDGVKMIGRWLDMAGRN